MREGMPFERDMIGSSGQQPLEPGLIVGRRGFMSGKVVIVPFGGTFVRFRKQRDLFKLSVWGARRMIRALSRPPLS